MIPMRVHLAVEADAGLLVARSRVEVARAREARVSKRLFDYGILTRVYSSTH